MTTPPIEDSIEDKLWILGINYGYFYDPILDQEPEEDRLNREAFIGQVQALIESEKTSARLKENAWSRQQMIVAQALEAPNSGFGRMIKWAIDLFNKRKLELLNQTKEPKEDI